MLICGAGIGGPTLAYWLARHGFQPTVVERAQALRSSGSPVDVHGAATEVARRMGILPRLHEAATNAPGLTFVTASGRRVGPLRLGRPRGDDVGIPRADLAAILCEAGRDEAEFLFGDSITALRADDGGVDVTFKRAAPRRFGLYIATLSLGRPAADPGTVLMYNQPGLSLTIHPVRGTAGAGFIFRGPPGLDYRDTRTQQRIVLDAYTAHDWPVPELPDLPEQVLTAKDLYFDSVSQVRLSSWSRGRVTLLGDAASCVSLFGDGSSLAMTGATTLAEAMAATPDDPTTALHGYEARHRKLASARQRGHNLAAAQLVPATRTGLIARNLTAGLLPDCGSHPQSDRRLGVLSTDVRNARRG
ncbi:FAD-dependent monooxygenase [Arthrobacter sp. UYCu723]